MIPYNILIKVSPVSRIAKLACNKLSLTIKTLLILNKYKIKQKKKESHILEGIRFL